jgi:adenylate cyclase
MDRQEGDDSAPRLALSDRMEVERRLAAILAADVAGYSRLVGADEQGTLRQWRAHWDEFIAPTVEEHRGRIVRITGDGILAEFASVVNAVRCAVAWQDGMTQRNMNVAAEKRIAFRIGVNVGDVIIDRGDMWGEGVNLAARLEALAEPGGICVSDRVQEDVRGKLAVAFEDIGWRQLKNIADPVRVHRVWLDAAGDAVSLLPSFESAAFDRELELPMPVAGQARMRPLQQRWRLLFVIAVIGASVLAVAMWRLSSAPGTPTAKNFVTGPAISLAAAPRAPALSIVVLPFVNLNGDAAQDYVADGITDSLTSDLSRALPGSFVVPRGTAFTYKSRAADARQIGRELGVSYLLAGSVLLDGERVRVNTQLVSTNNGSQLWAERFDSERRSILQVQDEIVARLSRAVGLKVVDIEAQRSEQERPSSAEAIDLIMRAKAALNRPSSPATMIGARDLFEQALKVQPTNVEGLAGVATTLVFEFLNGYYDTGGEERLRRAKLLLDLALTAEPRHLMALKAKSALLRAQGRFDDAIPVAAAVIAENPGEPWAYKEVGLSNMYIGRIEEALEWFAKAERIGPRDPGRWTWLDGRGHALILLGRDEEAVRYLRGALEANSKSVGSHAFLAAAFALMGRQEEAQAALAQYNQVRPATRVSTFRRFAPVPLVLTGPTYQERRRRLDEGLRKAGMPE